MAARRLIVHGDDFGLSERVNEGIVRAHREGILTSASLIASGEAFEHAIGLARRNPTLDLGVHLTLVGEKPILASDSVPTLVGPGGRFHSDAGSFMKRYLLRAISLDDVRRELDAQIAKVVAQGVGVSHLDGHQHLHMVPGIRRVVGELARKHVVPCIRHPREGLHSYMLRETIGLRRLPQLLVLNAFCAVAGSSDARRPDHFHGFYYGGRLSKQNLLRVLEHLASGTSELMCHPGLDDPESSYSDWGYQWQAERDALTDIAVKNYLTAANIELISYADIAHS